MDTSPQVDIRCRHLADFVEEAPAPPASIGTGENVRARMLGQFIVEGQDLSATAEAPRSFVVIFKDRPAVAVRGHGVRLGGDNFYEVFRRENANDVVVAVVRSQEIVGIIEGDLPTAGTNGGLPGAGGKAQGTAP